MEVGEAYKTRFRPTVGLKGETGNSRDSQQIGF